MRRFLVLAGLAATTACLPPLSGAMRPAPGPLSLSAPPEAARLVFVRPDRFVGSALSVLIFDGLRGTPLGKAFNGSAFVVDLPPGDYLLCGVPIFDQALQPYPPDALAGAGFRSPVSRLSVVAGRHYLLRVVVIFGGRLELRPARAGTSSEAALLAQLEAVRPAEVVLEAPELADFAEPAALREWFEFCLNSSGDDLRLRVAPEDGR